MSVAIVLKDKTIIRVQNSIFSLLHKTIQNLMEKNNVQSECIFQLLNDTDQEIYGSGAIFADIAKYLKTKNDLHTFADLVEEAIALKYDKFNQFIGCIDHLYDFHQELLKYAEELKE